MSKSQTVMSSVATKVIVAVVLTVTLVLAVAGSFLYKGYVDSRWNSFYEELALSAERLEAGINLPVWNLDFLQIERVIRSAMKDRNIAAVLLSTPEKDVIFSRDDNWDITGSNKDAFRQQGLISTNLDIVSNDERIGSISLYMTPKFLQQELDRWLFIIAVSIVLLDALLILVLSVLLWYSVLRPLKIMKRYAASIQAGDGTSSAVTQAPHSDEFGVVFEAFQNMIDQLQLHMKEIGAMNQQFMQLVENFPIPLSMYAPGSGDIVLVNNRFTEAFGYELQDMPDIASWFENAYPDAEYRQQVVDSWTNLIDVAQHRSTPVPSQEYQVCCKDKQMKVVEIGGVMSGDYVLGIFIDVTELRRSEREIAAYQDHLEELVEQRTNELVVARDNAEAANRAKSVFLANMSHELRTPLNSVIGFSRMMKEAEDLSDQQQRDIDIINRSGTHLLTLVNDILDLSKIEAGKVEITTETVNLVSLVNDVVEMLRPRATQVGTRLSVDTSGIPELVEADAPKLRQILLNLVSNAVKFTEKGQVSISVMGEQYNGLVHLDFSVKDTGIGIDAKDQLRIFEPFIQVENKNSHSGTGLGLVISRQYLLMMGSELKLESVPGQGSSFSFHVALPLSQASAFATSPTYVSVSHKPRFRACKVLVADDVPEIRLLVRELLEPMNLDIIEAENGEQARDLILAEKPQLLLMDWRMPGINGLDLTKELRKRQDIPQPAIIMMSAHTFNENQREALAAGVDDFLSKPIEFDKMLQLVSKHAAGYIEENADSASATDTELDRYRGGFGDLPPTPLSQVDLDVIPEQVKEKFQQALRELSPDKIEAALREIEAENPEIAARISVYTSAMRYRDLWVMFDILEA